MNIRYADIAVMLTTAQSESRYSTLDAYQLAGLWTANNDARGFTVIGDPAVKIPFAKGDEETVERNGFDKLPHKEGVVPPVMVSASEPSMEDDSGEVDDETSMQVDTVSKPAEVPDRIEGYSTSPQTVLDAWMTMSQRYEGVDAESYGLGDDIADKAKEIYAAMTKALSSMTARLADLAEDVSGLEVATYVSDDLENVEYKGGFSENAEKRAVTHISIDGDTEVCVPTSAGELDESLWLIHNQMVDQAMKNRMEMIKAAAEMLASLMGVSK